MTDTPPRDDAQPEPFVNTVQPPRVIATGSMIVLTALGLLLLWVASLNPIIGIPLNDPVALTAAGLMILTGIGGVALVWWQSAETWRKVPDGPLSREFRALADAGREFDAVAQLRAETGAGLYEAHQVLNLYRESRRRAAARAVNDNRGNSL